MSIQTVTQWVVINPNGYPLLLTARNNRHGAINIAALEHDLVWPEAEEMGYTCQQLNISFTPVAPPPTSLVEVRGQYGTTFQPE